MKKVTTERTILSAFTKDALLFQNAYCVSPTCSPSRAAMLSGMYPHQTVNYLKERGFYTALCGIQHESGWYLAHKQGAEAIGYHLDLTNDSDGYEQEELCLWDKKNAYSAASFIKSYEYRRPFFLSFGMYSTHRRYPETIGPGIHEEYVRPPYPIPNTPETRKDHARFLTSAQNADEYFKVVLDALKEKGIYNNTVIIFTTDHGLANPFSKCTLFDSGIGVSLIIRVPLHAKGTCCEALVSHVDIFPTLCDLLDLGKPDYLEGCSLIDCFHNPAAEPRSEIFAEVNFHTSYEPIRCVRNKRYKYIRYYDQDYLNINQSNIDDSLTKEFFCRHGLSEQVKYREALYDTYYDMGERNNLVGLPEMRGILDGLRQLLKEHMIKTRDPLLEGMIEVIDEWKVNKKECLTSGSENLADYVSLGKGRGTVPVTTMTQMEIV